MSTGAASPTNTSTFQWHGHCLELLAERAIWDPAHQTLLLADLHLGKAETFQTHGVPLPSDGDASTLNVLLDLARRHQPDTVIVLGDLIHSRLGLTAELRSKLAALPELLGCPMRLIGGNHERGSWIEDLPQEPSQAVGPWWLSHEPEPAPGLLNLCGHLHPVAVVGRAGDRLRLPCFSYSEGLNRLALPAFGQLTGGHPCNPEDKQWLVAEGCVMPWPSAPLNRQRRGP